MTAHLHPLHSAQALLSLREALASTRDAQHAIARDLMTQAIVSACRALGMNERECGVVEMFAIRSDVSKPDYATAHGEAGGAT